MQELPLLNGVERWKGGIARLDALPLQRPVIAACEAKVLAWLTDGLLFCLCMMLVSSSSITDGGGPSRYLEALVGRNGRASAIMLACTRGSLR